MCIHTHTHTHNALKDPSIPKEPSKTRQLPLMAFLSYKIRVDLDTTSLASLLYRGERVSKVRFCLNYTVERVSRKNRIRRINCSSE